MRALLAQGPFKLLQESVALWQQRRAPLLSAALAYYMVFSLSPLLMLSVSIASIVFGSEAAIDRLIAQLEDYLGREAAALIEEVLSASQSQANLATTLISAGILLFAASLIFRQLKLVLNMVWDTVPEPAPGFSGILHQVKTYLLSLLTALSVGLLLLLSLVVSTLLAILDERLLARWPEFAGLLDWAEFLVLWLIPVVLFAIIFKVLPDVTIAWRDVWLGALVTTLLFSVGARLVGLYFRFGTITSVQGAVGTVLVLLLWLYYSAQIFLMGAAFTRAYADRYGSHIVARTATSTAEE
jgi:membrane protein